MPAREPSDAEIDAAFNDIVARFTRGESGGRDWAAHHPLFADPDVAEGPDSDDASAKEAGTKEDGADHVSGEEGDREDPRREDNRRKDLGPETVDPDDGPVVGGEVLDPPSAADSGVDGQHEEPVGWRVHQPPDDDDLDELDLDELPRTPLPPWQPSSVALAALVLVVGSSLVTLLMIAQVPLPWWAGWAALVGFLTGMGLLFSRLPKDRDEDSDDGAVV